MNASNEVYEKMYFVSCIPVGLNGTQIFQKLHSMFVKNKIKNLFTNQL